MSRQSFMRAALCLVLVLAPLWARASPRQAAPQIQITIDDTAVRQLVALVDAKDSRDASVEKWLDLPANQYLLQIGADEDNLTRAQLKANAIAVIQGTATAQSQPPDGMGSLLMPSPSDYTRMLDDLKATEAQRIATIVARDAAFSPPGTAVTETVYLHLGGDWDAINAHGAIYVNIHFWHDRYQPSWDGLNLIIAHETMHTIQNAAYGNPEAQDTGDDSFLTALSKLQREGTARYVEFDTDLGPYAPYTYGFFTRAVDGERLRAFPQDVGLLQRLYDACYPVFDHARFVEAYQTGVNDGGPYYDIGHGMAKAIDEKMGRKALIETLQKGPKEFFSRYAHLCDKDKSLPKLPPDIVAEVKKMPERLPVGAGSTQQGIIQGSAPP